MKRQLLSLFVLLSIFTLSACGGQSNEAPPELIDKQLNQIMAAKSRFAVAKIPTPVLNTNSWDSIFGGPNGEELKYDRFGEIDEIVFVALKGTTFNIQRQIRKETRTGKDTIYYKVTTPDYQGSETLWVDGRFLDLRDIQPKDERPSLSTAKTLIALRRYEGSPYVWHGASDLGVSELLDFYPPASTVSERTKDDWKLRGFDSLGLLYHASNGASPLDMKAIARFGKAVYEDLGSLIAEEGNDDPNAVRIKQAKTLLSSLRPLDIIVMGDRMWTVLDGSEVIESKYSSKFAGKAQISPLFDTLFGLLQKGVFVENPFEELEEANAKKFYIRRYVDTANLVIGLADKDKDKESDGDSISSGKEELPVEEPTDLDTE
jgi:hypothetical protein